MAKLRIVRRQRGDSVKFYVQERFCFIWSDLEVRNSWYPHTAPKMLKISGNSVDDALSQLRFRCGIKEEVVDTVAVDADGMQAIIDAWSGAEGGKRE